MPEIQYDAAGKPYTYLVVNGRPTDRKVYLSPQAMGDYSGQGPNAKPSGSGLFHHHAQWNTDRGAWEQPFAWDNAMALGTGAAIAGPALAGAFAGGGGGTGTGAGLLSGSAIPSSVGATSLAAVAPTTAGVGSSIGSILGRYAIPQGISTVGNYLANRSANTANQRAADAQAAATKYAADLEAKAAEEALAWLKEQHQQRETQLTPYRHLGATSLTQLSTPIPNVGTILGGR